MSIPIIIPFLEHSFPNHALRVILYTTQLKEKRISTFNTPLTRLTDKQNIPTNKGNNLHKAIHYLLYTYNE